MKNFFKSSVEKPSENTDRFITQNKQKDCISEFNRNVNAEVDRCIEREYKEVEQQLEEAGYNAEEVKKFFQEFKRDMQIKIFEEFKKNLRKQVTEDPLATKNSLESN
jgi:hypothetical protein